MLPKDDGMPNLSRLRIILLLESDSNLCLKILWGRILHNVEHIGLSPLQFGSRPKKTTHNALIIKNLFMTRFEI